jgi:hypothetical protein
MNPDNAPAFLGPHHVVVPLAFFQKLLSCYYGQSPRLNEPTSPLPSSPVLVSEPEQPGAMGGVTTIPRPFPGQPWKITPMGAAAPVKEVPDESRTEPTPQR